MEETTIAGTASAHRTFYERAPYLTTHRALAACTRELSRLTDELLVGTEGLSAMLAAPAAVVRRPPGRCLIQLGPVALTAVWLRSAPDSAATGELMVNIWRGAVAPRMQHRTERPGQERVPEPAVLLWERVLTAHADDEQTWTWQPAAADEMPLRSEALARTCVDQLGRAYVEHAPLAATA